MWTMFRIETVLCTFSVLYVAAKADFKAGNCSEVREACVAKGFSFAHVPLTEISGEHLRVCSRGNTCCTQEMEDSFGPRSKQDFETLVDETSHELRSTFVSRHAKFDDGGTADEEEEMSSQAESIKELMKEGVLNPTPYQAQFDSRV
ncbi:glypican-6 [Gadus morhua]|uniref:glypican-6 n=1 Tax=Gadus morhua TaxID=8049 RepID=UPI0011B55183|nr:glypican-6-like [Gadus morhua]